MALEFFQQFPERGLYYPSEQGLFLVGFITSVRNRFHDYPHVPPKEITAQSALIPQDTIRCRTLHPQNDPQSVFLNRFERLRPRIEKVIRRQWGHELDAFETDNLIQAAFVHLWLGYQRAPEKFNECGDGFWYAAAKKGASYEFIGEFRQRYGQKGSGSAKNRTHIERVVSAGDILASHDTTLEETDSDHDETTLCHDTVYSHDVTTYLEVDMRLDVQRLIDHIYCGTAPKDHPLITRILTWMQEGLSLSAMARQEGVKLATIKCAVRRIRQACGAMQRAKENNSQQEYGATKDKRIQHLFAQGLKAPAIARHIGADHSFVYRRLRTLRLI